MRKICHFEEIWNSKSLLKTQLNAARVSRISFCFLWLWKYKLLQTKFKRRNSASILKAAPLEKVFFTHINILFINSVFQGLIGYTVSGYNIDYIFPSIINPFFNSNRHPEKAIPFVPQNYCNPKLQYLQHKFWATPAPKNYWEISNFWKIFFRDQIFLLSSLFVIQKVLRQKEPSKMFYCKDFR